MNKVILMGRLTRDPDVRYSQGENSTAVARYTLAVDRRFSKNEENSTDFINIVALQLHLCRDSIHTHQEHHTDNQIFHIHHLHFLCFDFTLSPLAAVRV